MIPTMHPTGDARRQYALHARRRGLAASSIRCQGRIIDLADRELGGLITVTPEALADWVVARHAPETRRTYVAALRAAQAAGVLTEAQVALLPRVRVPRRIPRPCPDEVVERLLETLPDPVDRAAVILARYAGLRLSECCSVGPEALERHGAGMRVRVVGKGGAERLAPIPAWAADEVRPWLPITVYPPTLGIRLGRAIKAAGGAHGLHTLRSAYATDLLRQGHDVRMVQHALGHASIATTAAYLGLDDDDATRAVEKMQRPRRLRLLPPAV